MSAEGIDFFDVDHTVTRSSTGRHYIVLGVKVGLFPLKNLLKVPLFYLQYRYGTMTSQKPFEKDFPGLAGASRSYLEEIARLCFRRKLKPDVFREAQRLIAARQQAGRRVVLATSSIDIIVQPLAEWLQVDLIASALQFRDGLCTGRFDGVPVFKAEKRRRVLDFIERTGVDPEQCSFYSDSIHDMPLLRTVGHPVAVNPDRRLRRQAARNAWPILRFKRRLGGP